MNSAAQRRILNTWLDRHRGLIFKVVRSNTRNHQDSEDLFQEIALQLWQSIPGFQGACAETTWIYRVAFFAASRWLRREGRRPETTEEDPASSLFLSPSKTTEDPRVAWLYDQISQLRDIDRSLFLLQLEGHSYSEIGEILGLKETAVGARLTRLKQALTKNFKKETENGL
jgi:RNA polymerase sigma-70 factor (ECF subfamily)